MARYDKSNRLDIFHDLSTDLVVKVDDSTLGFGDLFLKKDDDYKNADDVRTILESHTYHDLDDDKVQGYKKNQTFL